ncbi:iron chelate uptake ABC transporter family permease subunit [Devosia sp. ZB163]|uniref:FecCD family ABC transporter permease n=1 Tax=Devosia sp. ZB163 TaxID=3025938 RepID=UPI00235E8CB2|nr:iron chelate uptake ABC transporter family permease subunit [Devosia sp. ZB163]MDC9824338.1 iron chelate uptake ABC transporter family permease subunit [Devosia sp. ZB163]
MSTTGFAPVGTVVAVRRRLQRRYALVMALLAVLTLAAIGLALAVGDYPLPLAEVVRSLLSPFTGNVEPAGDFIVLGVRLPRAVAGLLAGGAFGLSGVLFQSVLRNPLASPDIVGITMGASATAVAAIIVFDWSGTAVSLSACVGAVVIALLIYGLSWRNGVTPYRLVLIGIGMSAIAGAVVSYLFTRARIFDVQEALAWLTGSLNGASFEHLAPLALALLVLTPVAAVLWRSLNALQLGDDTAKALGTRVELSRLGLIIVAVLLAAAATAAVGPVAFVAFVSGPIARRLLGPAGNALLPSALVGGLVTIGSDFVAQHMLGRNQLPVGVVTGAFGAVFLIYLLAAAHRSGRGG